MAINNCATAAHPLVKETKYIALNITKTKTTPLQKEKKRGCFYSHMTVVVSPFFPLDFLEFCREEFLENFSPCLRCLCLQ